MVIGAGPGGYTAAIKAAKSHKKVAVIDKSEIGGGCVNRGCIPTKVLLHSAKIFETMQNCAGFGVYTDGLAFDFKKMQACKEESVFQYRREIERSFEELGIDFYNGEGILHPNKKVQITSVDKEDTSIEWLEGTAIILATGATSTTLHIPGAELPEVINSDQLLSSKHWNYSRLVIIGGGVIGVEMATIFHSLFSDVSIIEQNPHLLGVMDEEVAIELEQSLEKSGIRIYCNTVVEKIEKDGEVICFTKNIHTGEQKELKTNRVLVAVGRTPSMDRIVDESLHLKMDNGRFAVDKDFMTSEPDVYAIGDMVSSTQLAHVAAAQATYVIEKLTGAPESVKLSIVPQGMFWKLPIVPNCIFTSPEIATVGVTKSHAEKIGLHVRCGVAHMKYNGKSIISGEEDGFIRLLFEQYSRKIIGAQIMCARATDMIGEMATAIANNLTIEQLQRAMRAHPTYSEGITAAIEDAHKHWNSIE